MNQKYLNITFTLLVFFFLIHFEKTYGCHPAGLYGCDDDICSMLIFKQFLIYYYCSGKKEIILFFLYRM